MNHSASLLMAADALLARALRGQASPWPDDPAPGDPEAAMIERIAFHGVAGLLAARGEAIQGWPAGVREHIRAIAIAHAKWELRHRRAVARVLDALARAGIDALVLKGTALAYSLYAQPAQRLRGDTDLLIDPARLDQCREVLAACGLRCPGSQDELEEVWISEDADGIVHKIDLHRQTLATPALEGILPFHRCMEESAALPGLSLSAKRMDYAAMLIHAAVHRLHHAVTPYFVGDKTYHDADRLIWLYDLDLLARAMDTRLWDRLGLLARESGVSAICHDALEMAARLFATPVPADALARLRAAPQATATSAYLTQDRQLGRALRNFAAIDGPGRKLAWLKAKLLPSASFMRGKYPHLDRVPLPLLYLWRIAELFVPRRRES